MAIFGQFTKRAQQVLMTAQECATREGQPYVGTLHFLYGLLDVGEAPESVTRHIQKEDVKQVLDQIDDEVSLHPGHGPVQMTPRARRVLDGSIIESRRLGQLYVGTEHMWLGILANPNCKAAELLAHRGVDASEAREELLARIRQRKAETPTPPFAAMGDGNGDNRQQVPQMPPPRRKDDQSALAQYGRDLTRCDISLQYAADKAAYETAAAQVERNKRLLGRQAISLQEYEISVANYQKAKSAYELSTNNMRDTKLLAPFDGSIEKRLVENYQRVNSGEGIVQLVNTHNLRIKFTIPDAYLYLLRAKEPRFLVEFDTFKGHVFQAKLEEYLDISTDGTGIPVSITIDDPSFDRDLYAVKPGFTCSIRFTADVGPLVQDSWTIVPLSAVFGESEGNKMYVWVVEDNKVHKREVTVNAPTGEAQALISEGLKPGEKIVIAGVYQLVEGESITTVDR